jgi:chaperone modulatory protein CbpM
MKNNIVYTTQAICMKYGISSSILSDMVSWGIANPSGYCVDKWLFTKVDYDRIGCAARLHEDLDINIPGAALAIELFEELSKIKNKSNYQDKDIVVTSV